MRKEKVNAYLILTDDHCAFLSFENLILYRKEAIEKRDNVAIFPINLVESVPIFFLTTCGRVFSVDHSEISKCFLTRGEIADGLEIFSVGSHQPGREWLLVSSNGEGFLQSDKDFQARKTSGRQVMNVESGEVAFLRLIDGDHVASVGTNRKVLIFSVSELPKPGTSRSVQSYKGKRLQRFKDLAGRLSDVTTFDLADGLSWKDSAGHTRTESELGDWIESRGTAGRMAPRGFPKDNRFR